MDAADVAIRFVYSSYGGAQFVQLRLGESDHVYSWAGLPLTVTSPSGAVHSLTFPADLPAAAGANRPVLLATAGFIVTPDFVLPGGFLFPEGGTIDFAGSVSFTYGPLPLDGVHGIDANGEIAPAHAFNLSLQHWDLGQRLPYALVSGTGGDDLLVLTGGWSTRPRLEGAEGFDTAVLPVAAGEVVNHFSVRDSLHVVTAQGSGELIGVERIRFTDVVVALDTHEGGAPWLASWTAQADDGPGLVALAQEMLAAYAPGISTADLVRHLCATIAGREATDEEVQRIVALVGPGLAFASDAELVAYAALLEENVARIDFSAGYAVLDPAFFF